MAMLQIGSVQFHVLGPSFESLRHSARFSWPGIGRFGRKDARQFTGDEEETVEISGRIYTDYFTGFGMIKKLRSMARKPVMVVSGAGDIYGRWCILEVGNIQTYHDHRGQPGRVEFTISLGHYGDDGAGFGIRLF